MTIDDLDTSYCNDFVCTSSPAVETTVRSLARDISRLSYNTNFFQPDVTFSDGLRSFKGRDKYKQDSWARAALKQQRGTVTKMAMLDNGRAQIDWVLSGQLSAFSVSIPVKSVFELNLLTGRVASHTDSFDLSGLSPPAAAAVTGSRALWSAQAAGRDASDAVGKAAQESLQSLSSQDEDEYYMNPNDPTRFFQKNDNTMNDAFMIATGVAALYLVYKVFEQIETL